MEDQPYLGGAHVQVKPRPTIVNGKNRVEVSKTSS